MSYIVIPIFSDPFLHPLHKDNGLSLLYVLLFKLYLECQKLNQNKIVVSYTKKVVY